MKDFLEILRYDSEELQARFKRSSIEGRGTSQEISDFREHAVQEFVKKYYPFPYRISKGGIYDSYGRRSDSVDCLILNPNHPHTVNQSGKHSLIVADGVDVAIEVKPDIANRHELHRALVQGRSVKLLRRRVNTLLFVNQRPEYIRDLSKQVPFFIFSMKAKADIDVTIQEIKSYYEENEVPISEQLDVVVIIDKGIIVNYKYKELYPWNADFTDEQKGGWFFEEWGANTLAGFLFHLDRVFGASTDINEKFLKYYLLSETYPSRPV
ncbi:hypothetical protein FA002_02215 [Priestia megaterium]|uniref:DUF6602 domain-containing protein n=1 Tax=Priestia megaterium TaxID=1404 RepID=UPI0010AC7D69|nr:DUF6602 domain-containing protein [Priestia megaterium]TJZ40406.1 hypothetical protein FA002_02215 [Priestia megaterium]